MGPSWVNGEGYLSRCKSTQKDSTEDESSKPFVGDKSGNKQANKAQIFSHSVSENNVVDEELKRLRAQGRCQWKLDHVHPTMVL